MDDRIGFGLYQPCGNRGIVGRVFWLRWCGWGVCRGLDQGIEEWGCVMSVCVVSLDYLCSWQVHVLCLADTCASEVHPVFNPVAPYGYLLPNMYLFTTDIANPGSGGRGWRGGEWMIGLGLGFTNPVGTGGLLHVCFGCGGVSGECVWGCCTLWISAS